MSKLEQEIEHNKREKVIGSRYLEWYDPTKQCAIRLVLLTRHRERSFLGPQIHGSDAPGTAWKLRPLFATKYPAKPNTAYCLEHHALAMLSVFLRAGCSEGPITS